MCAPVELCRIVLRASRPSRSSICSLRANCDRCASASIAQLDRKRTQIDLPRPGAIPSGGLQHTMLSRRNPPPKPSPKVFVEMLHIRFAAAAADTSQQGNVSLARASVDPAAMMKLVSRNSKRGAQFTPQGVLRWPLTFAKAQDVLAETRTLLESLNHE